MLSHSYSHGSGWDRSQSLDLPGFFLDTAYGGSLEWETMESKNKRRKKKVDVGRDRLDRVTVLRTSTLDRTSDCRPRSFRAPSIASRIPYPDFRLHTQLPFVAGGTLRRAHEVAGYERHGEHHPSGEFHQGLVGEDRG